MRKFLVDYARTKTAGTVRGQSVYLEAFARWCESREPEPEPSILSRALLVDYHLHLVQPGSGRHARARSQSTARKHLQGIYLFWRWAWDAQQDEGWRIPQPRKIDLPRRPRTRAVAPSWIEADAMIEEISGWLRRAVLIQRAVGSRWTETLLLDWSDVDLDEQLVTFRSENTKGGYGGRTVPVPAWLVGELAGWGVREGRIVGAPEQEISSRGHGGRDLRRAWTRAGVRREVWHGHPSHCLRKGVYSGLLALGAPIESVKILVGHQLDAVTGAYLDLDAALKLREIVDLVPAPGSSGRFLKCATSV